MPYCTSCGAQLVEGAAFCPNCGVPVKRVAKPRLELAGFGERFVAWLVDIVIIGAILAPIKWFAAWAAWPSIVWVLYFLRWIPFVDFGFDNVVYFVYWMFMEGTYGQSIGKMILKLKVTRLNGEPIDMEQAAIESLGKAFLLPIDCLVGWMIYPGKNQRLFNNISGTTTVRA